MKTKTRGKERIKEPDLAVLVKGINGVPFVEGLRMANEKNLTIASNARLGRELMSLILTGDLPDAFPCWSGTIAAYTKQRNKLGRTIEYIDPQTNEKWVFPVPKEYKNEKDAILVAEHPDYELEMDGKNLVVHAASVDLVSEFPVVDGWYFLDAKHGIPTGDSKWASDMGSGHSPDLGSRRLYGRKGYPRVGPIYRIERSFIGFGERPSACFGMAVEARAKEQ